MHSGWGGIIVVAPVTALLAALASWMVRRIAPESSGSAIPYVKTALREGWAGNPLRIITVKFVGGIMAIGGGLALGREGPTIQIGAAIGHLLGKTFRQNDNDRHVLLAAAAGAGLATAFNAPIAGAVFVLEELVGQFDVTISIVTLGTSAGAIGIAQLLLGRDADFVVPMLAQLDVGNLWSHFVLGFVFGRFGRRLLSRDPGDDRAANSPEPNRRGMARGRRRRHHRFIGMVCPRPDRCGDILTQQVLSGTALFSAIAVIFLIRFVLGPRSYSVQIPGGLFAPMLTIGSQAGLLMGCLWIRRFHSSMFLPQEFAVVGMAAFFTSVVRAPVTVIILVIELTGSSSSLLLPMLAASFTAMSVATFLKQPPIYSSLRVIR